MLSELLKKILTYRIRAENFRFEMLEFHDVLRVFCCINLTYTRRCLDVYMGAGRSSFTSHSEARSKVSTNCKKTGHDQIKINCMIIAYKKPFIFMRSSLSARSFHLSHFMMALRSGHWTCVNSRTQLNGHQYIPRNIEFFKNISKIFKIRFCYSNIHGENLMAIFTILSMVIWFSTGTLGIFATLVYVFTMCVVIYDILSMAIIPTLSTSILFCNLCYILL